MAPLKKTIKWSVDKNALIISQENAFENVVCTMSDILLRPQCVNTLRPRQNDRSFPDIFKCIFLNENV